MRRILSALLLILGLAPGTWLREGRAPWNPTVAVRFDPIALPSKAEIADRLGVFELEGAWALSSPFSGFGGYSSLVLQPGGRLLAISDGARRLTFSPPGAVPAPLESGRLLGARRKRDGDVEAATRDPASGTIWLASEDSNAITRLDRRFAGTGRVQPDTMRDWGGNSGAEAMVRLADGRFVVLAEASRGLLGSHRHSAVLFPGDPVSRGGAVRFVYAGLMPFSPTDMAQLPDGRVLILERRLIWPLPLRFSGRIVIADPAEIRPGGTWRATQVAQLTAPLPVDNFEALAIAPRADGRVTVWLMSDDNHADTQRTLLWKLTVDPARLPRAKGMRTSEKARK